MYSSASRVLTRCDTISLVPEEKLGYVNLLTSPAHKIEQLRNMLLKDIQIADPVPDELRSDQLPTIVPLLAIGGEDAVAQKVLPVFMEWFTLAVISKLSGQDCFDQFRVCGEDEPLGGNLFLHRKWRYRIPVLGEKVLPELIVLVLHASTYTSVGKLESCDVGLLFVNDLFLSQYTLPKGSHDRNRGARAPSALI